MDSAGTSTYFYYSPRKGKCERLESDADRYRCLQESFNFAQPRSSRRTVRRAARQSRGLRCRIQ
eukprot:4280209-Pyramimonas_sp.AAC.1